MSCIKEQAEEQYECEIISDIHTWPTTTQSGSDSQLFYIAVILTINSYYFTQTCCFRLNMSTAVN